MTDIRIVTQWATLILLCGFFAVIVWKMLVGDIPLSQLLEGDVRDPQAETGYSSQVSPARIQTLLVTLLTAVYLLAQTIDNPRQFPEIPNALLAILGGSHALYLSGKAKALFLGRLRDLLK